MRSCITKRIRTGSFLAHTVTAAALCFGGLLWHGQAAADDWMPPKPETYYSTNHDWRLTVVPRAVESALAYFSDKAHGRPDPGAPPRDAEYSARGLMEHRSGRTWNLVWDVALDNEISPVSALVSNQGAVATFNNWGSMGYGNNVVVIYDARGKKIRNLALSDFLPEKYIHALPRTVSSIWWSGDHRLSTGGKQLILRVVVPSESDAHAAAHADAYVNILVDMATGTVTRPQGAAWNRALAQAVQVDQRLRAQERAEIAFHNAPLHAPNTNDVTPWYRYLVEAFFRLDPDRNGGYPATAVLARPGSAGYARQRGYVKDALGDPLDDTGAIMLASPDQQNLIRVIDAITSKLKPNGLSKARVYVTVTPPLEAAAARAVARTGARFVPLDVTKAIPVPRLPSQGSDIPRGR